MKLTVLTFIIIVLGLAPVALAQKDDIQRVSDLILSCDSLLYDQPQMSLELAMKANELANSVSNDSLKAISLNRIGSAHWSLGNQMQALEKIQESLQISELNNFEEIMAKNLGDIGNVYATCGLILDAIGYYKSELVIQKERQDTLRLYTINNSLGEAFLDLKNYDSANHYLQSAASFLVPQFEHLHSIYYYNQAELYFMKDQSDLADSLIALTLSNAQQFKSKQGIIRANQLRAEWELSMDNRTKALRHAQLAFTVAKASKVKELIYMTSKTLSKCYGKLQLYQEAYEKQLLYEQYLDSVQSVTIVSELELLSYYQRLFQMRVLESKNTVNKELAEQRQLIIQGLVVALLIAAILIAIIVLVVRELGMRKRELEKLNSFRSKIFAIVSHDLKSPIQSVSSVIELFHQKLISKEEIEPVLPEVRDKTSNLMNLLNNIFLWAEGQMEGENLKKETFELHETLEELKDELAERLNDKKVVLNYPSAKGFLVHSDPGILRILLRNLIVNAIKFSNQDSTIEVNAVRGEKTKVIEVIDYGIGMTPEIKENIMKGELTSTTGTAGEKGNGLGLALCFDFAKSLGGEMEIESVLGKGSVFRIILKSQHVEQ
ncbi:ATP-binding protein [Ekhidna sp. To15]|uniref:ATP-binding protein n=1 Tax=Ekhidna sp. To15 TaxID=3395267 RepID=UPI003F51C85B